MAVFNVLDVSLSMTPLPAHRVIINAHRGCRFRQSAVEGTLLRQGVASAGTLLHGHGLMRCTKITSHYGGDHSLCEWNYVVFCCETSRLNEVAALVTQVEAAVAGVVDGLYAALVTLGVVPVIRCPKVQTLQAYQLLFVLRARHVASPIAVPVTSPG